MFESAATLYQTRAPWAVGVVSILRVVGQDPEMADYDNPRGDIIRDVYVIVAEKADGSRRIYDDFSSQDQREVEMFARAFDGWSPEFDEGFVYTDPAYGSEAYIRDNTEADRWMEERLEAQLYAMA